MFFYSLLRYKNNFHLKKQIMLKFIISIILFAFGFLVFNDVKAQSSKRMIVQYKIDLNDSENRESFMTKVYGSDLIFNNIKVRDSIFKTVEQCLFLARIRKNFVNQENFYDFYSGTGRWNEPLGETGAYERGILPTLYLSYEAVWNEDLQDFHYYPSLNSEQFPTYEAKWEEKTQDFNYHSSPYNKHFPFVMLELENEENKPTISYLPSSNKNGYLIVGKYDYEFQNPYDEFDSRTLNDVVILRMFKGKINKIYNYVDSTEITIRNQKEFDKWKTNYDNAFSSVLNYNYVYAPEQILWSQGLRLYNSDENFYYFEKDHLQIDTDDYILAMDTKAPENSKFISNGKNIFIDYFKEFIKEDSVVTYKYKSTKHILENSDEDYIYHKLSNFYLISRNKKKVTTKIDDYFSADCFYDAQKDSLFVLQYQDKYDFLDYLFSKDSVLAKNYYQLNFHSSLWEIKEKAYSDLSIKKITPISLTSQDIKELISKNIEKTIIENDKNTSFEKHVYTSALMCTYKLIPSKKKKQNTLFKHKKEFMEEIINGAYLGILRPRKQLFESFLDRIDSLKAHLGDSVLPYEKFYFRLELPVVENEITEKLEFYTGAKIDSLQSSLLEYSKNMDYFATDSYICIVVPAELSPTKKEYIIFRGFKSEILNNLIVDNPLLEFKNTVSLEKIFKERIWYGNLQSISTVNVAGHIGNDYIIYSIDNQKEVKRQSPKIKKFLEQIPKTITPASFE